VLEAGPGRGVLTRALVETGARITAVELDRLLAAKLRSEFADRERITIRIGDFLNHTLPRSPYKFFANIPFSRTADIVRKLAFTQNAPIDAYLVMETAAAVRFLGQPFGPESAISLLIKAQFNASVLACLNPADFEPPPSVNSVLLRLNRLNEPTVPRAELRDFSHFVRNMMRSGNTPVRTLLRQLLTLRQSRGLITDLNFPAAAPPSAVSFEHWLTVFYLQRWSRG
jgi:16S rRNA A1518/A1519 N6-dimethyltransferase RsmA/KsgA/DIM1 with predicted DNA glycosylase/AP lyase activity